MQSGETSACLAGAIADQFPQRFPDARSRDSTLPGRSVGGAALALSALVLLARRRMRDAAAPTPEAAPPA